MNEQSDSLSSHLENTQNREREQLLQQLQNIKRVDFSQKSETDLGSAVLKIEDAFIKEQKKDPDQRKRFVVQFEGSPGSGKTYDRKIAEVYLSTVQGAKVKRITWDIVEKEVMDEYGITLADPDAPMDANLLGLVANSIKRKIAEHIKSGDSSTILLIDKAGATQTWRNPLARRPRQPFVTREYGSGTIQELLLGLGEFRDIPRESFYLGAIGCFGGPSMDVFNLQREAIRHADNWEEANSIRKKFDLPPFSSAEAWDDAKFAGSLSMILRGYAATAALVKLQSIYEPDWLRSHIPAFIWEYISINPSRFIHSADPAYTIETSEADEDNFLKQFIRDTEYVAPLLGILSQKSLRLLALRIRIAYRLAAVPLLEALLGMDPDEVPPLKAPDIAMVCYNNPPLNNVDGKTVKKYYEMYRSQRQMFGS